MTSRATATCEPRQRTYGRGWTVLLLAAAMMAVAPTSHAADVVSPADGAIVPSRPSFVVDYAEGTLEVELSATPEIRTQGDAVGSFIEPAWSNFMLIGVLGRPAGVAQWGFSPRIDAGRYYWHSKPNDYATEGERPPHPWGPTRTLVVADEPPVVEGWTLRNRRVSRARSRCAKRYRRAYVISGTIAWDDNAAGLAARYTITLQHSSGKTLRLTGSISSSTARFSELVCTNVSATKATIRLRDPAGQLSAGPDKQLRLRP